MEERREVPPLSHGLGVGEDLIEVLGIPAEHFLDVVVGGVVQKPPKAQGLRHDLVALGLAPPAVGGLPAHKGRHAAGQHRDEPCAAQHAHKQQEHAAGHAHAGLHPVAQVVRPGGLLQEVGEGKSGDERRQEIEPVEGVGRQGVHGNPRGKGAAQAAQELGQER